jgi:hypothetical protein
LGDLLGGGVEDSLDLEAVLWEWRLDSVGVLLVVDDAHFEDRVVIEDREVLVVAVGAEPQRLAAVGITAATRAKARAPAGLRLVLTAISPRWLVVDALRNSAVVSAAASPKTKNRAVRSR